MTSIREIFIAFGPEYLQRYGAAMPRTHRKVIDAIMAHATTGSVGDGKIFVSSVDEVLDIGSKAVDEKAVAFATIPKQN